MRTNSLETTDIFRGAFFLCKGGDLSEIRFRKNGRQIASFMFTGSNLTIHDKDYRNSQAMVNPLQFRTGCGTFLDRTGCGTAGSPYKTMRVNNFNKLHVIASGSTWRKIRCL